jgi:hypothetical protein
MSGTTQERDSIADLPWAEPVAPRAEVSQAIRHHCTRDLCRRRVPSPGARVAISLLVSAIIIGALLALTRHHDRPPGALRAAAFGVIGWMLVQGLVLVVGLGSPPGKRLSRTVRVAVAVVIPIAFLAYLGWAAAYSLPVGEFVGDTRHAGWAAGCGFITFLFGALAAGCMMRIWRRTDPMTPRLSGAFAGLIGGLTGAVAVGWACPSQESWHLWLAHGVTVVALVCVGGLIGRRWLAP